MFTSRLQSFRSNNPKSKSRRRLGSIETLERRNMMAANVVANNNSIATATDLGFVQGIVTQTQGVGNTDRDDFYRIRLDETTDVVVRLDQLSKDADLVMYNGSGKQLGISKKSGTAAEQLTGSLAKGDYYIRVNYPSTVGGTNFRLTIDADAGGETRQTARNLGPAPADGRVVLTDWVGPGDSSDYFRFDLTRQSHIKLTLDQLAGDLDLYLYNANGAEVASSRKTGTSSEIINYTGSGTYYMRVDAYGAAQSDYRLELKLGSIAAIPAVPTGSFDISLVFGSGFTTSQQAIIRQAARRWEQVIVGDLPGVRFSDGTMIDDLMIYVTAQPDDGVGGTSAAGTYKERRSTGSRLPYYSTFHFDSADLDRLEGNGKLFGTAVHEMAHCLGFGTLWDNNNLIGNLNTTNPGYYGSRAVAEYRALTGVNTPGIPIETEGGAGSRHSHWREDLMQNEVMSSFGDYGMRPLSRITVGAMYDLGYTVNFGAADAYSRADMGTRSAGSSYAGISASLSSGGYASEVDDPSDERHNGQRRAALVDAGICAFVAGPQNRVAKHFANARKPLASPNAAPSHAARIAARESWHNRFSNNDVVRERPSTVRGSFDVAWDDLAGELLRKRVG